MPAASEERFGVCVECGATFKSSSSGPVAKFCSGGCRYAVRLARSRELRELRRPLSSCLNPYCRHLFSERWRTAYCSAECAVVARECGRGKEAGESAAIRLGFLDACRIFYVDCVDCGCVTVRRWKASGRLPCCRPCARRRNAAHNARKNHARRAAGPKVLTIFQIAERDGRKCSVCGRLVDMSLSGRAKWGPTIEHLTPVSKGGTNEPDNLALSHRHCNTSRGNRGPVQLLMSA